MSLPDYIGSLKAPEGPTAEQVRAARVVAGLTQAQAAALLYLSVRAWQQYEGGQRNMPAAMFEYFVLLSTCVEVRNARANFNT